MVRESPKKSPKEWSRESPHENVLKRQLPSDIYYLFTVFTICNIIFFICQRDLSAVFVTAYDVQLIRLLSGFYSQKGICEQRSRLQLNRSDWLIQERSFSLRSKTA